MPLREMIPELHADRWEMEVQFTHLDVVKDFIPVFLGPPARERNLRVANPTVVLPAHFRLRAGFRK